MTLFQNKNWRRATMILILAAACGCGNSISENNDGGEETPEWAQSRLDTWAQENEGETLEIQLDGEAEIACPQGVVCDENFDYRAFTVVQDGLRLRLSFDAALANEISLDLLEEHFNVASLNYAPPELQSEAWSFGLGGDVALRPEDNAVEFTGWEDGRAQGEIRTTLSGLRGRVVESDDANPECFMMDTALPEECTVHSEVDVPLVVFFDLVLPTRNPD